MAKLPDSLESFFDERIFERSSKAVKITIVRVSANGVVHSSENGCPTGANERRLTLGGLESGLRSCKKCLLRHGLANLAARMLVVAHNLELSASTDASQKALFYEELAALKNDRNWVVYEFIDILESEREKIKTPLMCYDLSVSDLRRESRDAARFLTSCSLKSPFDEERAKRLEVTQKGFQVLTRLWLAAKTDGEPVLAALTAGLPHVRKGGSQKEFANVPDTPAFEQGDLTLPQWLRKLVAFDVKESLEMVALACEEETKRLTLMDKQVACTTLLLRGGRPSMFFWTHSTYWEKDPFSATATAVNYIQRLPVVLTPKGAAVMLTPLAAQAVKKAFRVLHSNPKDYFFTEEALSFEEVEMVFTLLNDDTPMPLSEMASIARKI